MLNWEPAADRGFGPSVTHGWATQSRWWRIAAMLRRTLAQYVAVCPRLQLTSHTQPTSTLSRIKYERYIFIKKCVRSFIEVRYYCWLCFCLYLYVLWVYNKIIYLHTVKWLQILLFNTNYFIQYCSFSCRQSNKWFQVFLCNSNNSIKTHS